MKGKHAHTLRVIFDRPVRASILWLDIEALFLVLGAELTEGSGSRIRVYLRGRQAVFHRLHPRKETDRGAVVLVRRFLQAAGVTPE